MEGQLLNNAVVASFHDNNPFDTAAVFSAQVTWGDAATPYAATVLKTAFNDYDVLASHTYAEETAAGATLPVTVTIGNTAGIRVVIANTATVSDAPLTSTGAPSIPGVAGVALSVTNTGAPIVATFTDSNPAPDAGDFAAATVIVNWGDGTPSTAATSITRHGSASGFTYFVQADHTYAAPGDYQILVIIPDAGGSRTVATSEAIVTAGCAGSVAPPAIPIAAVEGQLLNNAVVASFHDNNPFDTAAVFSAQVTWGDAATPYAATVLKTAFNDYDVLASHTYAEETAAGATLPVTVTIGDTAGIRVVIANTATVSDAPLTSTGAPSIPGVAGVALSVTNTGAPIVATFTDSNPAPDAGDFSAATVIVHWGDGTPSTAATSITQHGAASGFTYFVQADHTYAAPGDYQILVIIPDAGGSRTVATSEAIVTAGPPAPVALPAIPIAAVEGQLLNNAVVASFHDNNPFDTAAVFSAQVTWGDAATPYAATVLKTGFDDYDVLASHTYAEETAAGASLPVTVTIGDTAGIRVVIANTATVSDAPSLRSARRASPGWSASRSASPTSAPRSSPPSPTPTPRPMRATSRRPRSSSTGGMGLPTPPPRRSLSTGRPRASPTSSRAITPTRRRGITRS